MVERRKKGRKASTGESKGSGSGSLADKLAPGGKVPSLRTLSGIVGEGEKPGLLRLYETPTLDSFVELDRRDVLHMQAPEGDRVGAATVWVESTTEVRRVGPALAAPGDFLRGGVVDTYLPASSFASPAVAPPALVSGPACATIGVATGTIAITVATYSWWHTCYTHLCPLLSWSPDCPFGAAVDEGPKG